MEALASIVTAIGLLSIGKGEAYLIVATFNVKPRLRSAICGAHKQRVWI